MTRRRHRSLTSVWAHGNGALTPSFAPMAEAGLGEGRLGVGTA
jgi:hypothetical protein